MDEKTLRRAGLDYWKYLEWEISDTWDQLMESLGQYNFWFFSRFASSDFRAVPYAPKDVLVFGNETAGLPKTLTSENAERLLRIPMFEEVRSLNLASSVAVAGYECQRQLTN